MALGVDARKRLMGGLFVFFAFGGETGLINENEGDIYVAPQTCGRGGIGRRAALRSLWANPRGSSSLLDRTIIWIFPSGRLTKKNPPEMAGFFVSDDPHMKRDRYRVGNVESCGVALKIMQC